MGEQEARSEAVRLTTIEILAIIAAANGALIALTGPEGNPSFALLERLWIWPQIFGSILLVSGATQLFAVRHSKVKVVVISCSISAMWYAFFAGSFLLTWLVWKEGWFGFQGDLEPSLYPTAVYLGLSCLHLIQGYTAWVKHKTDTRLRRKIKELNR